MLSSLVPLLDDAVTRSHATHATETARHLVETHDFVRVAGEPTPHLSPTQQHLLTERLTVVSWDEQNVSWLVRGGECLRHVALEPIGVVDATDIRVAYTTPTGVVVIDLPTARSWRFAVTGIRTLRVNRLDHRVHVFASRVYEIPCCSSPTLVDCTSFLTSLSLLFSTPPSILHLAHNTQSNRMYLLDVEGTVSTYDVSKQTRFVASHRPLDVFGLTPIAIFPLTFLDLEVCLVSHDGTRLFYADGFVLRYTLPPLGDVLFIDNALTVTTSSFSFHDHLVEVVQPHALSFLAVAPPDHHDASFCFDHNPLADQLLRFLSHDSIITLRVPALIKRLPQPSQTSLHYGPLIADALFLFSPSPPRNLHAAFATAAVWLIASAWTSPAHPTTLQTARSRIAQVLHASPELDVLRQLVDAALLRVSNNLPPKPLRQLLLASAQTTRDISSLAERGIDVARCPLFVDSNRVALALTDHLPSDYQPARQRALAISAFLSPFAPVTSPIVVDRLCRAGQHDVVFRLVDDPRLLLQALDHLAHGTVDCRGFLAFRPAICRLVQEMIGQLDASLRAKFLPIVLNLRC